MLTAAEARFLATQLPDAGVTSSDELLLKWEALDRLLGEADKRAHKETGGVSDLYRARADELIAPICDRFNEIEGQIANMVPTTIGDCLLPLHLLKVRREYSIGPDELDDQLVDNLIAGIEIMVAAGEPSAGGDGRF